MKINVTKNKETNFLCDICGKENTGKKYEMYDENWNFEGCYKCKSCFEEELKEELKNIKNES